MNPIDTAADVEAALLALERADPRLAPIIMVTGAVPLRRRDGGFEGLAAIVINQQISNLAADAIWSRLRAQAEPFSPELFLAISEGDLRSAGLSRGKVRTLTVIAEACSDSLDLDSLAELPAEAAIAALTSLRGIGSWTAESYLLFCLGHPDVFPAGDLALQIAAQHALSLPARPTEKALREIAAAWSPWRSVAARLLWAYYKARRDAAKVNG